MSQSVTNSTMVTMIWLCTFLVLVQSAHSRSLVEVLRTDPSKRFTKLIDYLDFTGLSDELDGGKYTMFAPTSAAFDMLDSDDPIFIAFILKNKEFITDFLNYHLRSGSLFSSDVTTTRFLPSVAGEYLVVDPGLVNVNGNTNAISGQMNASNGVIYVIDKVLFPESAHELLEWKGDFDMFLTVLDFIGFDFYGADGDSTINTILSPTDESWSALSLPFDTMKPQNEFLTKSLVDYLVLKGTRTSDEFEDGQVENENGFNMTFTQEPFAVNGVPVVLQDILASNGVLHVIDEPLRYPSDYWTKTNLVERLTLQGEFETLLTLLNQTGLDEVLTDADAGPYTIFAPTDRAFERLGEDNLSNLTDPENIDLLRDVLLYHVLENITSSESFGARAQRNLTLATLLSSENINVNTTEMPPVINEDVVLEPANMDVLAWNGVIHVVTDVLLPLNSNITRPDFNETLSPSPTVMEPTIAPSRAVASGDTSTPTHSLSPAAPFGAFTFAMLGFSLVAELSF